MQGEKVSPGAPVDYTKSDTKGSDLPPSEARAVHDDGNTREIGRVVPYRDASNRRLAHPHSENQLTLSTQISGCGACAAGTYSLEGASSCFGCAPGQYTPPDSSTCQPCEQGTHAPTEGSPYCNECQPGFYATIGASVCTPCTLGYYSYKNKSDACKECDPGSWAATGASVCTLCAPGSFSLNRASVCLLCSAGKFTSQSGMAQCDSCAPGTFSSDGASSCPSCEKGSFSAGETSQCDDCISGTYASVTGARTCIPCTAGQWSDPRASTCTNCQAGTYSSGAQGQGACIQCPAGFFSSIAGAVSNQTCQKCAQGSTSPPGGTVCNQCPPNSFTGWSGYGCEACPEMSVSPSSAILEQCVCVSGFLRQWEQNRLWFRCMGCEAGKYSTQNNASMCTACAPGKFAAQGNITGVSAPEPSACLRCGEGLYTFQSGATVCLGCIPGTYSNETGKSECTPCLPGFVSGTKATQCSACTAGKFSSVQGQEICTSCLPGTFSNSTRSTACRNCSAGYYSDEHGQSECKPCRAGSFSEQTGLKNGNDCQLCARARYSTALGASSRTTCQRCEAGLSSPSGSTGCTPCPPGEFPNTVYGACSSCPRHSVNNTNTSSLSECRCGPGYFMGFNAKAVGGEESHVLASSRIVLKVHTFRTSPISITILSDTVLEIICNGRRINNPVLWRQGIYSSMNFPDACTPPMIMQYPVDTTPEGEDTDTHTQCIPCPPGTFSEQGGECLQCLSGQYQGNTGSTKCDGCPPGTHNPSGGDACIPCRQGTFQEGNQCIPCPDGSFTVGIAVTVCTSCPASTWSNNVSGGCRFCPTEATSPGGTGPLGCVCPAGSILTVAQNIPYCTPCIRGTYSLTGSTQCTPCPAGTFGNNSRLTACFECPTNLPLFSNEMATVCVLCAPGRTPSINRSQCDACPPGKVCLGNGTILDCPTGSFMTTGGLSQVNQCQKCPQNFFCINATTRQQCPTGTFSKEGSTTSHECQCTSQFNCVYSTQITKRIVISMTRQEFEARRLEIIRAIAESSNISSNNVQIVSVQTQGQNLRRVADKTDKSNPLIHATIATVRIYGKPVSMNIDNGMIEALRKRGIPVKHVHTPVTTKQTHSEVFKPTVRR